LLLKHEDFAKFSAKFSRYSYW